MTSTAKALAELRSLLSSGRYGPGDKLPTERELSEQLATGRRAVRKAISFLEAEGKLWRHVGRGTFVGKRPVATTDLATIGRHVSPEQIMEFRFALEPEMARLAALRATPAEVDHMRSCHVHCVEAETAEIYETWDSALHTAIAEATHNGLMISVFNTINALRTDATWGRLGQGPLMREQQKRYTAQHGEIVEMIGNRAPDLAAARMADHIEAIRHSLMAAGVPPTAD